ncbi:hypothetical protein [Cohnella mopanensis]|uniref:hypothetical protein n=1 Tax=Cohnella mopanensis TaxID=2911966 RepID=UPI001EF77455|nr:hypothetical protein [Cohnella mopanensis]
MNKDYFSTRVGIPQAKISLRDLIQTFISIHKEFYHKNYLREFYGFEDKYGNWHTGFINDDFEAFTLRTIGRKIEQPTLIDNYISYKEYELFDVIELLHEYIIYPIYEVPEGKNNEWRKREARSQYRTQINNILRIYNEGWELSIDGYIRELIVRDLSNLIDEHSTTGDSLNVDNNIASAKKRFLKYGSTIEDKRAALIEIAAAFEYIRKQLEKSIPKEESDIFQLLNRFGIRHNKLDQLVGYDKEIYYHWIFYYFISAFDAYNKLTKRDF